MKFRVSILLLCSGFFLTSCDNRRESGETTAALETSAKTAINGFQPRINKPYLTQQQAAYRSSRVTNVSYELEFTLTGQAVFSGVSKIIFELKNNSEPLTVDLNHAELIEVSANGQQIKPEYNGNFLTLPVDALNKGTNEVTVSYKRKHSTNGEGLHRFVDSIDNRVYLYSHFEPAAASQMFALFDQPDLKATYQLTVNAPSDWSVISAKRESKIEKRQDHNRWYFPVSSKLSPYNFSMHAGPYKVWKDKSAKYPLRLFARQSIANKIVVEDWFKYTKLGLEFFDNYFEIGYPFEKYDQVIVPDFLYGAMENAAAITFAERAFVRDGAMSAAQKQRLAGVIMHEMAHQWFGNLVTMKWWNGLWLNESFAAFMGTLATAEATEFDYAWRSFYAGSKQSAYAQDQRVTTHPIEVPVPTSTNAFDNIDAITYSKGASTLMQLRQLLGPDDFRKGVKNYLNNFAYDNAELDDFIGTLAKTAGRDLSEWKTQWLYHEGVNSITAVFQCEQNKITEFILNQTAQHENGVLREQKVQVGLFSMVQKEMKLINAIPVIYKGKTTKVPAAIGLQCPDLVYPNYQDWGFVKVNLDAHSFHSAKQNLAQVNDPLLRSMLWQSLWDNMRDGKLALQDYLETAVKNMGFESDYTTLRQALNNLEKAMAYAELVGDSAINYRQKIQPQIEALLWDKLHQQNVDTNFKRRWFSAYLEHARSEQAMTRLKQLLTGTLKIDGLIINQPYRWDIIYHLNRFQQSESEALLAVELVADKGDSGQKNAIASEAIRPDPVNKQKWLDEIHNLHTKLPFAKIRSAINNLFESEQVELEGQFAEQIFNNLAQMDKEKGIVFMRSYVRLIPTTCSHSSIRRLQQAIDNSAELSNLTRRALLVALQEDQRCVMIGEAFLNNLNLG